MYDSMRRLRTLVEGFVVKAERFHLAHDTYDRS
jgi:hypothetical protein